MPDRLLSSERMTPRARKWMTTGAAAGRRARRKRDGVVQLSTSQPRELPTASSEATPGGRGRASATAPPRAAALRVPAHAELSPLDEARGLVQSQPERALHLVERGRGGRPRLSADERAPS